MWITFLVPFRLVGAGQLAGVGVALSMFNTVTKLTNMPLLSVTTSTVAAARGSHDSDSSRLQSAVSSALIIALCVGVLQVS